MGACFWISAVGFVGLVISGFACAVVVWDLFCVAVLVLLFWWVMVCCVWSWWFVNVGRCKAVLEFGCIDCGLCCIDSLVAFVLVLIFDLRVGGWLVVGFSVGG